MKRKKWSLLWLGSTRSARLSYNACLFCPLQYGSQLTSNIIQTRSYLLPCSDILWIKQAALAYRVTWQSHGCLHLWGEVSSRVRGAQ